MLLLKGSSFGMYPLFLEDEEQEILYFLEPRRSRDSRISEDEELKKSDCSIAVCIRLKIIRSLTRLVVMKKKKEAEQKIKKD